MPDTDNGQHWLDRNRPPRVQITYDLETGEAVEKRELPLVVGVLSDLSGENRPTQSLADRKFIDIDRDNFSNVLESIAPRLDLSLADHSGNGPATPVSLSFRELDDFSPLALIHQVPRLRELYENRQRLRDMLAKLDGNAELGAELERTFAQDAASGPAAGQSAPVAPQQTAGAKPAADKATPDKPGGEKSGGADKTE